MDVWRFKSSRQVLSKMSTIVHTFASDAMLRFGKDNLERCVAMREWRLRRSRHQIHPPQLREPLSGAAPCWAAEASLRSRTNRDSFPAGDQLDIAPDPHSWAKNQPIAHSAGSLIREPFAVARQEAALSDR